MKYWNKSKKYRKQQWYKVATVTKYDVGGLKLWCQRQPGEGRFYYGTYTKIWWFEKMEDASWFVLKWAS